MIQPTDQRRLCAFVWTAFAVLFVLSAPARAEPPVLRIASLEFGTVAWELDTIRHHGLDRAEGFTLAVQAVASATAARIAFQGGEVDAFVTDWIWAARQRAAGHEFVFLPYSKAVGGLMVPAESPVRDLQDLRGRKIGIAGGPLDKSWLIFRALAAEAYGFDLAAQTRQVFGAAPLIFNSALRGRMDAAVNYWNFTARMSAAGMRQVLSVADAAERLGLEPNLPLLGYVLRAELLRGRPDLVGALSRASRAAKSRLAESDKEWERLRTQMGPLSDAEFEAVKGGFRAGIPEPGPVDEASAARLLALMAQLGGTALVGSATDLPEGLFVYVGS